MLIKRNLLFPENFKGKIMKKLLLSVIAVVMAMMPVASFAQAVVSDSDLDSVKAVQGVNVALSKKIIADTELDEVTAEAGVSIRFADVTVKDVATSATLSIGDSDGFTGYTGSGYMGANAISISGNVAVINGTAVIDVGTSGSSTRVNMTLPTATLGAMNVTATMKLSSAMTLTGANVLGSLNLRGFSTQVTGGSVQIYAH